MGVRRGIHWGKIGIGSLMLIVGGGIAATLWFETSHVSIWAIVIAGTGLVTLISGLVGRDGLW